MQVYKRTLWGMLKGIVIAPCTAVVVYIALRFFTTDQRILVWVPIGIFFILIYMAILGEAIRFELADDGTLRYFKRGRLKQSWNLPDCAVGYYRKSNGGDHNITLHIFSASGEDSIDCSPIGLRRFERLYEAAKIHTGEEPEVLTAKPEILRAE